MGLTDADLKGCWEMDEASGNAIDANITSKDLTESGTVPAQTGHINGARGAYTSANYFSNTNVANINEDDDYSFSWWMYRSGDVATDARFLSIIDVTETGRYYFNARMNDVEKIRIVTTKVGTGADIDVTSTNAVANETWTHFVWTYNGTSGVGKLYVNGSFDVTDTASGVSGTDSTNVGYGKELGWAGAPFVNGHLDQLAYWVGKELTSGEVTILWNGGAGIIYPFEPPRHGFVNFQDPGIV